MNMRIIHIMISLTLLGVTSKASDLSERENVVYFYNDEGVGEKAHLLKAAYRWDKNDLALQDIDAETIKKGGWESKAAALVIPGGADLPYCHKLNGQGNKRIKDYVTNGGTYIGICAGGYYGGSFVEFDKGGSLEVLGDRELKFFPGIVRGPSLAPYVYNSEAGARTAKVVWSENIHQGETFNVYFNGGGHFVDAEKFPQVKVLCQYQNSGFEGLACVVECEVGKGKAILTGIHPEYTAEQFKELSLQTELTLPNVGALASDLSDLSHQRLFTHIISRVKK